MKVLYCLLPEDNYGYRIYNYWVAAFMIKCINLWVGRLRNRHACLEYLIFSAVKSVPWYFISMLPQYSFLCQGTDIIVARLILLCNFCCMKFTKKCLAIIRRKYWGYRDGGAYKFSVLMKFRCTGWLHRKCLNTTQMSYITITAVGNIKNP